MNPYYSTTKTSPTIKTSETPKKSGATRERREVANELSAVLASTYVIYLKTQNYHWNVTGPLFGSLHRIFDEQYHELADSIDKIAERIRAIGSYSPATFKKLKELSDIEEDEDIPSEEIMVKNLADDHEHIRSIIKESILVCDNNNDLATSDLLIKRVREHEKYAWMLRSFLTGEQIRASH